jgi:hypothetical protein
MAVLQKNYWQKSQQLQLSLNFLVEETKMEMMKDYQMMTIVYLISMMMMEMMMNTAMRIKVMKRKKFSEYICKYAKIKNKNKKESLLISTTRGTVVSDSQYISIIV